MISERLRLRPLLASDAEALHSIHELVGHGRAHRTVDELREIYREMEARSDMESGWHGFVIELNSGAVIGDIGICIDRPEEKQAEIGYSLDPRFWGAGYATEALKSLLTAVFSKEHLHRIVAVTRADNSASRALLERLRFRLEAHYKSAFYDYRTEEWVNSVGYALLADEWAVATT